ncbi:MAG: DUF3596 domain-containing protein [Hormoscilla sp. GUM202]|nr:DUF3596 domain-containing protein [Hormoscilla sp. GUM202]
MQRQIISLGLQDNPTNRKQAEFKAREIELDIDKGDFDQTLNRYGLREKLRSHPDDDKVIPVSLAKLYEKYITSRQDLVKPSTWTVSYQGTLKRLRRSPFFDVTAELTSDQAYQIYDWAISRWSPDIARQLMMQLNACFNWATAITSWMFRNKQLEILQ